MACGYSRRCHKNPGHEKFIAVQEFKDRNLHNEQGGRTCEALRCVIDLTVRLMICNVSTQRPDDDEFSEHRGTNIRRCATGYVERVDPAVLDEPCPCSVCDGTVTDKKHWRFRVRTARHNVFDTDEAKNTRVDFFFDDESCDRDGRRKSAWGVEIVEFYSDRDISSFLCVTCDVALGERIESTWNLLSEDQDDLTLTGPDFLSFSTRGCALALIVSHPHGRPKRITLGEWRDDEDYQLTYTTPTCPGSSGAPVLRFIFNKQTGVFAGGNLMFLPVHFGSDTEKSTLYGDQVNFGCLGNHIWTTRRREITARFG